MYEVKEGGRLEMTLQLLKSGSFFEFTGVDLARPRWIKMVEAGVQEAKEVLEAQRPRAAEGSSANLEPAGPIPKENTRSNAKGSGFGPENR